MKKKLEMLEQLQEVDSHIDTLKKNQNGLSVEIKSIEEELETVREELAVLNAQASLLEQEKQELEANLVSEHDNIKRSETNMKEIKTNKEFQAIGREISSARKQVTELEEQILQKSVKIEELNTEIANKSGVFSELEQKSSQLKEQKQTEIDGIQQNIDTDNAHHEEIAKELPADIIKRYNLLRQQRHGQAVAFARDGHCLGCNMNIPPQLYNTLYRADQLINCPHCQRILILKHN